MSDLKKLLKKMRKATDAALEAAARANDAADAVQDLLDSITDATADSTDTAARGDDDLASMPAGGDDASDRGGPAASTASPEAADSTDD